VVAQSVAVDGALARYREAVQAVRVDESLEVVAGLALDAGFCNLIVADEVAAHQHCALFEVEVSTLLEVQTARHEHARWHHDDAAAIGRSLIDQSLDFGRVDASVGIDVIVGEFILLAKRFKRDAVGFLEPFVHHFAIWPCLNCGFLLFGRCRHAEQQRKGYCKKLLHFFVDFWLSFFDSLSNMNKV